MKTLKTIIACLILAISCVAFVGCNKDKEERGDNTNSIVGRWRYSTGDGMNVTLTFNADGTYVEHVNVPYDDYILRGTYVYATPYLIITYEGADVSGEIHQHTATINGDVLILDGDAYVRLW